MFVVYKKDTGKIIRVSNSEQQFDNSCDQIETTKKPDPRFQIVDLSNKEIVDRDNLQELLDNQIVDQLKSKRNSLLLNSDWTQLPDVDLTSEQKMAWQQYRQALRDMDFSSPIWPEKP